MPRCWGVQLFLGLSALGCSSASDSLHGSAHGHVYFQGQPLVGGKVVFTPHPERGPLGERAIADISSDGSFRLSVNGGSFLAPGWYRVAIAESPESSMLMFPSQLRRPDLSGLEREVQPGRDNLFDFYIECPRP